VVELAAEGAVFRTNNFSLALSTLLPLHRDGTSVTADFSLRKWETASFVLASLASNGAARPCLSEAEMEGLFQTTVAYWRHWLSKRT